ncbi:hypothetical protein [Rugamonas aquatica]|uniref:Uncharacterized protein n=1 Tax=Rugamonas aquatica TaxID=2743357 RepID=A0A6A7N702_9BURK|nr:hypothetical protein [Rugamonas aquatica]MQA40587.1 hypothetical protein [Rugamonas aquatica]
MLSSMMQRAWRALAGGVLLLAGSCAAGQSQRVVVADLRPLMLAALDSADGTALGEIRGDLYRAVAGPLGLSTPLLLDIRTLLRYRQPGCARLLLHFHQEGVRASLGQAAGPRAMDATINYCRDGRPPAALTPAEGP